MLNKYSYCSIFRKIACIGDSLSSGEVESIDECGNIGYHDCYEYSWGQFMARKIGSEVYNFSRGGMTAQEYMETFADLNGYWDEDKKCQAYIIALGVNDLLNAGGEVGCIEDICEDYKENKKTFVGYYAQIIQKIKLIQPRARVFLVTIPRGGSWDDGDILKKAHRDLLETMCEYFDNTYLIDLFSIAPVFDESFKEKYFLGGHMAPAGYLYMAQLIESCMNNIIESNLPEFADVCFIGTDLKR